MAPVEVSGFLEIDDRVYDAEISIAPPEVSVTPEGVERTRSFRLCSPIESSDPRLTAEGGTYFGNSDAHFPGDSRFFIEAAAHAFTNEGGS